MANTPTICEVLGCEDTRIKPTSVQGFPWDLRAYPKRCLIPDAVELRAAGLTYKAIALKIGVSGGTVYKWLNQTSYK